MEYKDLVGIHNNEACIICGCGPSILTFEQDTKSVLFGVNDVNKYLNTKYLLCVNEEQTFINGRYHFIETTSSDYLLSHLNLKCSKPVITFNLGELNQVRIDNIGQIDFTANSPYMAIIIAYQMGFKKIGLIGVDFLGKHALVNRIDTIDSEYKILGEALIKKGIKIGNLSPISKLRSWPYMNLENFNNL